MYACQMWSTPHFVVKSPPQPHFQTFQVEPRRLNHARPPSTRIGKMPGLTASELPAETLSAGDRIEYFSRAFVCGDKRGQRSAVVVLVDPQDDMYPVRLDTEEVLPLDNLLRRTADQWGNCVDPKCAKWRKLRTYKLEAGSFAAPTRSSALNSALTAIVHGAITSAHREVASRRERIPPGRTQTDAEGDTDGSSQPMVVMPSSASGIDRTRPCSAGEDGEVDIPSARAEEIAPRETRKYAVIDLVSESDIDPDSDHASEPGLAPTDSQLLNVQQYLRSVPTRYVRARIRHQKKRRAGEWHVSRSRKRRHQRACAVTRSGDQIHHAHTVTAKSMKNFLSIPGVRLRLVDLHERRKTYIEPVHDTRFAHAEVTWPACVERIESRVSNGVTFPDLGDYGKCRCEGDCFVGSCDNAVAAVYCTDTCCALGAMCSNAPRVLDTLKLFETGRVGLSVYTTADMDVGAIVGEYTGDLSEYDAVVPGQPPVAVKQNSGYTLLYNTKSVRKKFVYVDALRCGSITRFISHSCTPNAEFFEMQNGAEVKVLVRMLMDVKAGAQITVHYGDETWFTCMCEQCWASSAQDALQDGVR